MYAFVCLYGCANTKACLSCLTSFVHYLQLLAPLLFLSPTSSPHLPFYTSSDSALFQHVCACYFDTLLQAAVSAQSLFSSVVKQIFRIYEPLTVIYSVFFSNTLELIDVCVLLGFRLQGSVLSQSKLYRALSCIVNRVHVYWKDWTQTFYKHSSFPTYFGEPLAFLQSPA